MNNSIINAMNIIKNTHGIDQLTNSKKLRALLLDYLSNKYIGEINLIICCLQEKIPQKIISSNKISKTDKGENN